MKSDEFSIKFWGARGSIAAPGSHSVKFGGNTSCVEMLCGDRLLVFDAGTGIRELGRSLVDGPHKSFHLLFTHCHFDHISGLPFFAPLFDPSFSIDIWSGHLNIPNATRTMISDFMKGPYFPVGVEVFKANITHHDFKPRDTIETYPEIAITTCPLNHHDECVAYRVDFNGKSACYVTDTTHTVGQIDQSIVSFVKDADLMIYDSAYTDEEFSEFQYFGHSTWQEGVRICKAANVKRLGIFHHRPSRTDHQLEQINKQAAQEFSGSFVVQEGSVIKI